MRLAAIWGSLIAALALVYVASLRSSRVVEAEEVPDFICEIPNVTAIITPAGDADFSKPLAACDAFAAFSADTQFTYLNIANAWSAAGMNMDHCAAAVVIAAGECQPPTVGHGTCDLKATGASGLFQTDWVVSPYTSPTVVGPDARTRVLNPCENARYGYGNIVRPPDSYDKGCYTGDGGAICPPVRITCATQEQCPQPNSTAHAGGCDWDYSRNHCNWCAHTRCAAAHGSTKALSSCAPCVCDNRSRSRALRLRRARPGWVPSATGR